jgi:hypothetical protein
MFLGLKRLPLMTQELEVVTAMLGVARSHRTRLGALDPQAHPA